jgi:L-lactate dehydrogenase complex protein LldG
MVGGEGTKMNARAEILARVRAALGPESEAETPTARDYIQATSLTVEQRLELFTDRLRDYDSEVHHTTESEVPSAIRTALSARSKRRIVIPRDFPSDLLPLGFDFIADEELSYAELDAVGAVLTVCTAAIALTGTIILQDAPGQGRRAITLIPDYHLCIVRAEQVFSTVPEAIRFLHPTASRPTTTVSGPSATSDIEMTRIKGVHGPRTLEVILVV